MYLGKKITSNAFIHNAYKRGIANAKKST